MFQQAMASPKILRRRLYRLLTNLPVVFPGPFLALNIGFWSTATLFEIAILFSWCSLIEYSTERPRRECLKGEPSTKQHLKESTLTLVGPAAVSTVCLLSKIGPILMPGPYHWEHSLVETGLKFLAMMFIHDFLLYSIHRLLHESEFLFHHVHAVSSWCTYAAESVSGSDIIRRRSFDGRAPKHCELHNCQASPVYVLCICHV